MNKKLKCVLLIDDDEDDNFYHQVIIDKTNIAEQVHTAESAEEALELLSSKCVSPDLIFLDINMPRIDAWGFMEHYNKFFQEQNSSAVIMILTTSLNPAEKEMSKHVPGISGFITKPVTEKMLLGILNAHFNKS